jgi:heterodisulfide reductase subunit A-like polyferredoxin
VITPAAERTASFTEFHAALSEMQAREEAARCLRCGICSECNQCVFACRAGAIRHNDTEKLSQINVGAVVLTPGVEAMPGDIRPEYGYGHFQMSSPACSSSACFRLWAVQRCCPAPIRRAAPSKVAWINVLAHAIRSIGAELRRGSYCSSVCCMYATKEAMMLASTMRDQTNNLL